MKIGILRGRFDLIHCGHLELFQLAKELVDKLYVFIDTNEYAQRNGKKLISSSEERYIQLNAIKWIDEIYFFGNEEEFITLCENIVFETREQPAFFYYFKGGDYSPNDLPEAVPLRNLGFKVICLDYNDKYSTTKLKEKIYQAVVDEMKGALQKIDEVSKKIKEKLDSSDVHYIQLPLNFGEEK